ncbi:MAG: GNAT family N-acetyltransferase [Ruminococcus sp.]|nr:GNAT family N-acetyltransferase [Ruminococcus sp.]
MELRPIYRGTVDADYAEEINKESFPDNEYVPLSDLLSAVENGDMEILGIYTEYGFSGFLMVRKWTDFVYICFFAVKKELRSHGIGTAALHSLKDYYDGLELTVDYEAPDESCPNNEQRIRRQEFYRRCGFCTTGWYQFYMNCEFEIASTQVPFNKESFESLNAFIHSRVPQFDPHLYRKD